MWSHGVMVSTQDSESCNPSSNLGGTFLFFHSLYSTRLFLSLSSPHSTPLTHSPDLLSFPLIFVFIPIPTLLSSQFLFNSKISHDGIWRAMSANKVQSILHPIPSVRFIAHHTEFKTIQSKSISTMARSRNEMSGCAVHLFFDFEFVKWIHFAVCPSRNRCQQCE